MNPSAIRIAPALFLLIAMTGSAAAPANYGRIELLRDRWGIPHVFSDTDPGALYGLGWATADERGFQMTYSLRIIQGRLAEILGDRKRPGHSDTALEGDRRMRTFGWVQAAERVAAALDPDTRDLLGAYCAGVNDSFARQRADGNLHPLFERLGVKPEPWTPADCLLSWWHVSQFFATDGTRDLMVWRNAHQPDPNRPRPPRPGRLWQDDAAAVVQESDVSREWMQQVRKFADSHGMEAQPGKGDAPKFSHAWVVGGSRMTTGNAVLVSDPQTPVRNPSLWMEFHLHGRTLEARGIGVPGSPGLLIGFTPWIAWGLTALGADQADLFRLETSPDHPDAYRWNDDWRPMRLRDERIRVKGGDDIAMTVRETHVGPLVSEFAFRRPGDPEVALKRVPICDTDRDTIQAVFGLMRARTVEDAAGRLNDWRFPSANCVFADSAGHIGYQVLGATPIRPAGGSDRTGNEALEGSGDAGDWQGFVPPTLLPRVLNPARGLLWSANHRPVASFYPIALGLSTGSMGDTVRSWRLREKLTQAGRYSPLDVLNIHFDSVNPARRELVRLGLHLRRTNRQALSEGALHALHVLEPWWSAGASSDLHLDGASLATRISTFFRFVATPLALRFGGGESGLTRFLKDSARQIAQDPEAAFDPEVAEFVDRVLSEAWNEYAADGGGGVSRRGRGAGAGPVRLAWFDSLDGYGSLGAEGDLDVPPLACVDGQTLVSQAAQSYTQWVPVDAVDSALTVCPIGHSDRPDSPFRTSTLEAWAGGRLHPAPLSRAAVDALAVSTNRLSAGFDLHRDVDKSNPASRQSGADR